MLYKVHCYTIYIEKYGGYRMDRELMKGSIDILLLSLLLEKDCYGYEMAKNLRNLSNESYNMNEGTLYPALQRLEKKNYVVHYWSEELDGKRRKYYSITEDGKSILDEKLNSWKQINQLIKKTLGELS